MFLENNENYETLGSAQKTKRTHVPHHIPSASVNVIVLVVGGWLGHLAILLNSRSKWCSIGLKIDTRGGAALPTTQLVSVPSFVATPDPLLLRAVLKGNVPIRVVSVSPMTTTIRKNLKLLLKDSIPLED